VDGFWYVFSDYTSCDVSSQLPLSVFGGAIPAQLLPTDDSRRTDCNQYAMHSSIDKCSTFSGFGAVLAPEVNGVQNNAPIDVSAYDGLSFWIKAGSATTTGPIFVEVLDRGCIPPSPDGSGNAQSVATDRYNCHGALLKSLTTEWKQVFIPFGTLAPRWIPTRYVNPNNPCSSSDFCEAPALDIKNVLGIQFSLEEPWTKVPQIVTSYDVWVDDVAFYKFSYLPTNSGLATWEQTGTYAFPQNRAYPYCAKPEGADGRLMQNAYDEWKRKFIVADGSYLRAVNPELDIDSGKATYAESIAYGLLLSVYLADRTLFDGLLGYWKMHPVSANLSMLMRSAVNSSILSVARTQSSADEDAAFALQMAVRQWGADYQQDADTILSQFLANDVDANGNLKPSNDASGNAYPQSPGYFAPAYYKYFATVDPAHASQWNSMVSKGYAQLASISGTNGLVPGWCVEDCSRRGGGYDYVFDNFSPEDYQYDAHHTPWRIGLDRCWNDDANAKLYLDTLTAFFVSASKSGLSSLGEIYRGEGSLVFQNNSHALYYNSMSLIGGIGVGAMATTRSGTSNASALRDRTWRFLLDAQYTSNYTFTHGSSSFPPWRDFRNTTFGLIAMLTLSGNFYPMTP
jgi:endo-1,4-beta-D-glucanase Y